MLKNDTLKNSTYRFIWKCPLPPPPPGVKSDEIEEPRRQLLNYEEVRSEFFYAREEIFKMQTTSKERGNK